MLKEEFYEKRAERLQILDNGTKLCKQERLSPSVEMMEEALQIGRELLEELHRNNVSERLCTLTEGATALVERIEGSEKCDCDEQCTADCEGGVEHRYCEACFQALVKEVREAKKVGECPDHPEAVCCECAVCDEHKELVACYTCYNKMRRAGEETEKIQEANTFLKSEVKRRGRVAADAQFKTCDKCERWEKEYVELEKLYHSVKDTVLDAVGKAHVASTLHDVVVKERENKAVEVEHLKLRLEDANNKKD